MQPCKVSLVPLPDLMMTFAGATTTASQSSLSATELHNKTHVPNVPESDASTLNPVPDECKPNKSLDTKRKHVRFALEHDDSDSSTSASSTTGDSSDPPLEGKRPRSSLFSRELSEAKDPTALCNKSRNRERPLSPPSSAMCNVVVKAEADVEEDFAELDGELSGADGDAEKKSAKLPQLCAIKGEGPVPHEIEKESRAASPVAVVTHDAALLASVSDAPRRRLAVQKSTQPGRIQQQHNNNHQPHLREASCTESASSVTETEAAPAPAIDGQTPSTTKHQEFSTAQGRGIFTAADDVNNNNNFGSKVDKKDAVDDLLAAEDDVIVIGDTGRVQECVKTVDEQCGTKCNSVLVIEDDDDVQEVVHRGDSLLAVAVEEQHSAGHQDHQVQIEEELEPIPALLQNPVIEIKEQDGDDDVTFVCSKSAISECLLLRDTDITSNGNNNSNNNSSLNNNSISSVSAVLGDALATQQQRKRILTAEEQLHESLKATSELIAGIGVFGFVSNGDNMSFMANCEENCLGAGNGTAGDGGSAGNGQEVKVSAEQQHAMNNATLHNSLATFGAGASSRMESTVGGSGGVGDEYNDDDEILLDAVAPVADIISRLSDSPKCLTFNEMGEIEAISANAAMFEKHTMDSMDVLAMSIKELAEKNIAKAVVAAAAAAASSGNMVQNANNAVTPDSCGGGGVGGDEYPRDLTCKLTRAISAPSGNSNKAKLSPIPRPVSRGSDAIQSPQPSGLPAIPQSPDIFSNNTRPKSVFLESILSNPTPTKPQSSVGEHHQQPASSEGTGTNKQKEPLDLGTSRKSASPTVTCSEEVSKRHHDEIVDLVSELESSSASSSTSELSRKRVKYETQNQGSERDKMDHGAKKESSGSLASKNDSSKSSNESMTGYLMDILNTNAKDPDPLTQLRLLISNTEWKVPETLLVPKDRLNAVLASPAREIPLLLTTRPELRLPGAFAFPSILQDPDILVVSLAQLEAILEKQQEIFKLKSSDRAPQIKPVREQQEMRQKPAPPPVAPPKQHSLAEKQHQENLMHQQIQRAINSKLSGSSQKPSTPNMPVPAPGGGLGSGLANEIDAATIAAFNQMLWLPYLNQMRGQLTPEVIKAIAGFNEMLPLLAAQSRIQQGLMAGQGNSNNPPPNSGVNPLGNSLEFAMWQEAMLNANNANLRALLKGHHQPGSGGGGSGGSEFSKKPMDHRKAPSTASTSFPTPPGKMAKHQAETQHLPNPLSPLSIPPFVPPAVMQGASARYFNPMLAATQQQNNRSPMPSPTTPLHSPFSPSYNFRQQQQQHQGHLPMGQQQQQQQTQRGSHRFGNMFSPGGGSYQTQSHHMKKAGVAMPPNQFFPFGQNPQATAMDFEDQMSVLASKKAQKELEQVLQMQQQQQQQHQQQQQRQQQQQQQQAKFAQDQKLSKLMQQQQQMNSFLNSAKMSLHHQQQQQQQQMFNQQMMNQLNELSKLSSLMAMPSAFDSPMNPNPLLSTQHQQGGGSAGGNGGGGQDHGDRSEGGSQPKMKLKVKPGMHLLDPLAMQRRLLTGHSTDSSEDLSADIVSTTSSQMGMDTSSPDINSPLWHPLFGNR